MTAFGYTLMTEQSGPRELVRHATAAERAGFDFEVCSDHFFPWLDSMGHSPYAWAVLGAVSASVQPFVDAGFTDVAVVQIGDESQEEFLASVAEPLLDKVRDLTPTG